MTKTTDGSPKVLNQVALSPETKELLLRVQAMLQLQEGRRLNLGLVVHRALALLAENLD